MKKLYDCVFLFFIILELGILINRQLCIIDYIEIFWMLRYFDHIQSKTKTKFRVKREYLAFIMKGGELK